MKIPHGQLVRPGENPRVVGHVLVGDATHGAAVGAPQRVGARPGVAHADQVGGVGHRRGQGQRHRLAGDGHAVAGDAAPGPVHRDPEGPGRRLRVLVQGLVEGQGQGRPVHRRALEHRQRPVHFVGRVVGDPGKAEVGGLARPGMEGADGAAVEVDGVPGHRDARRRDVRPRHGVDEGQRFGVVPAIPLRPPLAPAALLGEVDLQARPAAPPVDVHRSVEGHRHPDLLAEPVGAVGAGVRDQPDGLDHRHPVGHRLAGEALQQVAGAVPQSVGRGLDVAHRHRGVLAAGHRAGHQFDLLAGDVGHAGHGDGAGPAPRRRGRHPEGAGGRLPVLVLVVQELGGHHLQEGLLVVGRGAVPVQAAAGVAPVAVGVPGEELRAGEEGRVHVGRRVGHLLVIEGVRRVADGPADQRVAGRALVFQGRAAVGGDGLGQGQRHRGAGDGQAGDRDRAFTRAPGKALPAAVKGADLETVVRGDPVLVQGPVEGHRQRLAVHRRADETRPVRDAGGHVGGQGPVAEPVAAHLH